MNNVFVIIYQAVVNICASEKLNNGIVKYACNTGDYDVNVNVTLLRIIPQIKTSINTTTIIKTMTITIIIYNNSNHSHYSNN